MAFGSRYVDTYPNGYHVHGTTATLWRRTTATLMEGGRVPPQSKWNARSFELFMSYSGQVWELSLARILLARKHKRMDLLCFIPISGSIEMNMYGFPNCGVGFPPSKTAFRGRGRVLHTIMENAGKSEGDLTRSSLISGQVES